jgi:tetratricopeptide (TPR) repeat protein
MPVIASLLLATALAGGAPASRPHVDPDAMREVRRDGAALASRAAIAHYLEAQRRLRREDWTGAAAELRQALAYDPESAELRLRLAETLARAGRADEAETEVRGVLAGAPSGALAVDAHLLAGHLALLRRDHEAAILSFRQATRAEEARAAGAALDPAPWVALARAYLVAADEAAAVRVLEDLARRAPGEPAGWAEAGAWLLDVRDPTRAERFLRRAADVAPDRPDAWRLLARAHGALGRGADVQRDLLEVIRTAPDDGPALEALARAALVAGEPERGRGLLLRWLDAEPDADAAAELVALHAAASSAVDALEVARAAAAAVGPDPRLRVSEGEALRDLRRWPEAVAALQEVGADAGAAWPAARALLADVLARSGRAAQAERALAPALQAHPVDARLLAARASLLARAGDVRGAVALLARGADDRERAHDAEAALALHLAHGETLRRAGRAPEAVGALERALVDHPRSAALLAAVAAAHLDAGDAARAQAELAAALALDPDHARAEALLARALAARGERLDEAERLARRAAAAPRAPDGLLALSEVLAARGDLAGAVAALERAAALTGGDPEVLDRLGDAYRAAGRPPDAAAAWRRALVAADEADPPAATRLRAELPKKLAGVKGGRDGTARRAP